MFKRAQLQRTQRTLSHFFFNPLSSSCTVPVVSASSSVKLKLKLKQTQAAFATGSVGSTTRGPELLSAHLQIANFSSATVTGSHCLIQRLATLHVHAKKYKTSGSTAEKI